MYAVWVFVSKDLDLSCLENGKIGEIVKNKVKIKFYSSHIHYSILLD